LASLAGGTTSSRCHPGKQRLNDSGHTKVNERVNLEMMKRFEAEAIEFAFPSQTLYVKKE
jgi:small-conductance mechanosensitive channel